MMKNTTVYDIHRTLAVLALVLCGYFAEAQTVDGSDGEGNAAQAIREAEELSRNYEFSKAGALLENIRANTTDSTELQAIDDAILQCRNGKSMMQFVSRPVPVAKRKFSKNDFFLWYPLEDGAWRPVPNPLDGDADEDVRATYVPADASAVFFSKNDENGIRNIYQTFFRDTVWTAPELVEESLTSSDDEIFPMLSPTSKNLWFASKGLYGSGGYDLYVSRWNDTLKGWGVPENMGFPYSSPANDYLFVSTADGKYSVFASDRECGPDSVYVYVLEYDALPVHKAIDDPRELIDLMKLEPNVKNTAMTAAGQNIDTSSTGVYVDALRKVESLRESIGRVNTSMDKDRERLGTLTGAEAEKLKNSILDREMQLPQLQDSLTAASKALQGIEMDFLMKGVMIDMEKIQQSLEEENTVDSEAFAFVRHNMGPALEIKVEEPVVEFDYSFMVLEEGRFAEDNTLPGGIVYQIQLFAQSKPATVASLKGLSPVFERTSKANGHHVYSVGVFRTYKDVLSHLNTVKKTGFRSAIIVAFNDGEAISVAKARQLEQTVTVKYRVRIYPSDGKSLPENVVASIHALTDADIAITRENGAVSYIVSPFDSQSDAQIFVSQLKALGVTNLKTEELR